MTVKKPGNTYWEQRYDPANERVVLLDTVPADKKTNISCSYNGTGEMHMLSRPLPEPREGEVLLHVKATGICGSDIHFWRDGHIGNTYLDAECGAGHESAGVVLALGPGVTTLNVGDRVAIEAGIPCSQATCETCRRGDYNHCPHMVFHSAPPYHGTLTRFLAHPAAWLHRLPDSVSFEEGALCEPLAVALAAVERAEVRLGDPILICGAGPIGLLTLLCAAAAGAAPILITDVVESRLEFAKSLVPRVRTLCVKEEPTETALRVKEILGGGVKVAIECTGFESSVAAAVYSCASKGRVMVVGVGPSKMAFPFDYVSRFEVRLDFLFRYAHQYPKAIRLVTEGVVDVKPLVTHRFALEEAVKAFDTAVDRTSGAIKVQIVD